jgi:hypothetical protein
MVNVCHHHINWGAIVTGHYNNMTAQLALEEREESQTEREK